MSTDDGRVPTAPCHWGGGNDIIWCSTCGAEYAYARGETRPPCPRASGSDAEVQSACRSASPGSRPDGPNPSVSAPVGASIPSRMPTEPPPGLLMSMAMRFDHALAMSGFYDRAPYGKPGDHKRRLDNTLATMSQLWEEVAGCGFYAPHKEQDYADTLSDLRQDHAPCGRSPEGAETLGSAREHAVTEGQAPECEDECNDLRCHLRGCQNPPPRTTPNPSPSSEKLRELSDKATPGPWKDDYNGFVQKHLEMRVDIGACLPCINGLSAWFTIASLPMPDEAEEGMSDGARNRRRVYDDAAFIVALVNAYRSGELVLASTPAPDAPGSGKAEDHALVGTLPFRCPECRCHSFARVAEQKPDRSFAPGPLIRCVECKSVFRDRHYVASAPAQTGTEDKWIPIKIAPDDGTPVLVGWAGRPWDPEKGHCEGGLWGALTPSMGFVVFHTPPTHWQHLPPPPASDTHSKGGER